MARKPGGANRGVEAGRQVGIDDIERDARRALGGGSRPSVVGRESSGEGGADPAPGADVPVPRKPGTDAVESARPVAAALRGKVVGAIRGYHGAGLFITGHAHWKEFEERRVLEAADTLADVVASLPPVVQGKILVGLAYSSVALVAAEMFVAPVVKSVKLNREEREEAAKTREGANGGADKQP